MEIMENFAAIFSKEGTDVETMKTEFIKRGAKSVQVSYDYIVMDDDPNKAVTFFVEGMTWNQCFKTRLDFNLRRDPRLPESHYVCIC